MTGTNIDFSQLLQTIMRAPQFGQLVNSVSSQLSSGTSLTGGTTPGTGTSTPPMPLQQGGITRSSVPMQFSIPPITRPRRRRARPTQETPSELFRYPLRSGASQTELSEQGPEERSNIIKLRNSLRSGVVVRRRAPVLPIIDLPGFLGSTVKKPLEKKEFENIPEKKFEEVKEPGNTNCTICEDEFSKETTVAVLPCDHLFHKDCLKPWLDKENHTCPLCRKQVGHYRLDFTSR